MKKRGWAIRQIKSRYVFAIVIAILSVTLGPFITNQTSFALTKAKAQACYDTYKNISVTNPLTQAEETAFYNDGCDAVCTIRSVSTSSTSGETIKLTSCDQAKVNASPETETSDTSTTKTLTGQEAQSCYDTYNAQDITKSTSYASSGCSQVCTTKAALWNGTTITTASCDTAKIKAIVTAEAKTDPTKAKNLAIANAYAGKLDDTILCGAKPSKEPALSAYNDCVSGIPGNIFECISKKSIAANDTSKLAECLTTKYAINDFTRIKKLQQSLEATKDAAIKAGAAAELDAKNQNDCVDKGGTWTNGKCVEKTPETSTCSADIGGIGWIICPTMNYMAKIADGAYGYISDNFLSIESKLISDKDVKTAWSNFRNLANLAFVFAFLIVIYSQITGAGISNYGIKRMLPRLIVAALLVNLSFYVCALAVDVSNLVGYGINGMFEKLPAYSASNPSGLSAAGKALTWVGLTALILAAGAAALLALSTPVIIATLLSLLMIVLILVARKALVVLLIVVSPLAFIAYLLPNTEQWFKRWFKLFSSLLMLFPVIGVVFAASKLAAQIIANTASSKDPNSPDVWIIQLTALGIEALPFFVVPSMLKGALAATGSLGAKLQGMSKQADSRFGKKVGESRLGDINRYRQQRSKVNQAKARAGINRFKKGGNKNPLNWGAAANRVTNRAIPNRITEQYERTAAGIEDKEFEDKVSAAEVLHKGMLSSDIEQRAMRGIDSQGHRVSEAEQVAAIREVMKNGNTEQRLSLIESSAGQSSNKALQSIRDGVYAKGMQSYLGGGIGDKIMQRKIGNEDALDQEIASTIEAGKTTPESLVSDGTAVNRLAKVIQESQTGVKRFSFDIKNNDGKVIGKEQRGISASALDVVGKAARTADSTPTTKSRIAGNMSDSIERLKNLSSVTPQAPIQTATHGSQTFNQNESGLYVPRDR